MQELELTVDFNGIVIFDPALLVGYFSGINVGDNLYGRFVSSDEGDRVVSGGIVLPILGLNDSNYKIILRRAEEPSSVDPGTIIVVNGAFPLKIATKAIIADMATLREWSPDENWHEVSLAPGNYSVNVNGFRKVSEGEVIDFGFELVFEERRLLPKFSGSLDKNMQVLELPS